MIPTEQKFLTKNKYSRPGTKQGEVKVVVLHWVENKLQPAAGVWQYFENRKYGTTGYGSTHYVIGINGEVIQMIPEREVAYSIGNGQHLSKFTGHYYTGYATAVFGQEIITNLGTPNNHQISIELCHIDWDGTFTDATLESAAELVAGILDRHYLSALKITTHHNIVGYKDCPKLWVDHPELFQEFVETVQSIMEGKK